MELPKMPTSLPPKRSLEQPPGLELVRSVVVDAVALAGSGLMAYGAWSIYPPAGYIVAGFILLAAGLNGARR